MALLVLLLTFDVGARAQSDEDGAAGAGAGAQVSADEVTIDIETFGAGGVVRPGEWAGVRLSLRDRAARPRSVVVELASRDADGDMPTMVRTAVLNPGQATTVWMYVKLPWWDATSTAGAPVLTATVSEPGEAGPLSAPGRTLGVRRVLPGRAIEAERSMYGVIGRRTMGLEQYAQLFDTARSASFTWHEVTEVVSGIEPVALPDSWLGLAAFDVLLWSDGDPLSMPSDLAAQALREWVARGGHLVIVLPPVGATWNAAGNRLGDLVPAATIVRHEAASLEGYRDLLTLGSFDNVPLPDSAVVQTFDIAAGTSPADATPILQGPHGCIAVRRLLGTGMVTMIGIDVGAPALQNAALLRADVFWNRVLGRRSDTLTGREVQNYRNLEPVRQPSRLGGREALRLADRNITPMIEERGKAGVGVLTALLVFIAYWFIAGPVGFALLKARRMTHHAWLAFVLTAIGFSAVAWAGASALRPARVFVRHVSLVDHVYGQDVQRSRTWMSVVLPEYGDMRVTIGDENADQRWSQALSPWIDPDSMGQSSFPDARAYRFDAMAPREALVPARSTIKQFQADWLGGRRWSTPIVVDQDEPRVEGDKLVGSLSHDLPGPLSNVTVVLVRRPAPVIEGGRSRANVERGAMPAEAYLWMPGELTSWSPGQVLNLSALQLPMTEDHRAEQALVNLVPRIGNAIDALGNTNAFSNDQRGWFRAVALYGMLEPPEYYSSRQGFSGEGKADLARPATHTWDLAPWFTQPCLIIMGEVAGDGCPTPISVDGRAAPSQGVAHLRWVYPLEPAPSVVSPRQPRSSTDPPLISPEEVESQENAAGGEPPAPPAGGRSPSRPRP